MKISHIEPVKLVEGLDRNHSRSYRLWESAGHTLLKEYQIDPKLIPQLFQEIEAGLLADPTGANRTMLGKGKDTAAAVNKAYEDLKDKVYNSKPMANFAAAYDKKAAELKTATGGDQGVMKYIQKYRDFAEKHPILHGAVYAILIAALGLSGAGLGGAALLGLLKLSDQLLQGKDIRSATWSGAKTGAMAYAASSLLGGQAPETSQQFPVDPSIGQNLPADIVAPPGVTSYTIEPGDTLSDIAKKMNVSVDELMKANDGATHYMSNHDPDMDKFTNVDAMGNQTGPQDYEVTKYTNPKIDNPDVLSPGQQINIPSATGSDIYQGGTGLAQNTTDRIASGEFTDSAISRAQQAKWDALAKAGVDTGSEAAKGAAGGVQQAIANRAAAATDSASDIASLAADQAGGGVTDIDTLKQGIAANSDAAQAATNTDGASAMSSQSDATVKTATDFTSQGAPQGQAASSYAGGGADTATNASDTATNASDTTSKAADATKAAQSGKVPEYDGPPDMSDPKDVYNKELASAQRAQIRAGIDPNTPEAQEVAKASARLSMKDAIRHNEYLKSLPPGAKPWSPPDGMVYESKHQYIDPHETIRMWALKESLGRRRGGLRLTEAGVQRLFTLVEKQALNEGIMDTLKSAAGKVGDKLKQTGKNLTNKVTADKLNKAWVANDRPSDSEVLTKMMLDMGVPQPIIDAAFAKLGIKDPGAATGADAAKDAGVPGGLAGASQGPAAAGGSQFVKDLVAGYMALSAADRAEIMKELDIAIDVSSNSNLVKGMNENKRRKKKAVQ